MAFCTNCGANVQGAFCPQCGTPSSASTGAAAAPPDAPPPVGYQQAGYQAPPPVPRKTSPLVWILLGIVGLVVLCIIGVGIAGYYFVRNPGVALGKLITASNPNVEVLNTDVGSKTMRIRDRRTGKEVVVSFDDVKNGRLKIDATGDDGQVASIEIGEGSGKMPSWVPAYPGAKAQGNFTAKGENAEGMGEGGMVSFTTGDPASKVMEYYEAKCKEAGMTVDLTQATSEGGMMVANDGNGRTLQVMVGGGSGGQTTIAVTFGRKR